MLPSPIWTGAVTACKYSKEAELSLTFEDTGKNQYSLCYRVGDLLMVPRGFLGPGGEDRTTTRQLGAINCIVPPRTEEQAWLIERGVELFEQRTGFVIQSPTGSGKTYIGAAIAGKLGQATLIVTNKNDLHENWRKAVIQQLGVPAHHMGHVQQGVCDYKGKRFVLASLQSLIIEDKYPPEFYSYFGMVVFDEVDVLGAEGFSKVCTLFPAKYRLGLSATTDRWDGRQNVFEMHIGPVLLKGLQVPMKAVVLKKFTKWKPPIDWEKDEEEGWVRRPMSLNPGRMVKALKHMGQDIERNSIIREFVVSAYRNGRTCLVLSDLTDHLKTLFTYLSELIPAQDIGWYVGGMKPALLEMGANKRVVLGTLKMVGRGTDYPHWDSLVLASPHADVRQAVGRVLRYKEGKHQPVILDLVDDAPILRNGFWLARQTQYYRIGATIVRM
jgi:superfamily II DNA or RNA helicase